MTIGDYPNLDQLMRGYFHQDYDINGDVPEVVAVYASDAGATEVVATIADIGRYLTVDADADADFANRYPNEIDPAGWDMTARQWLGWVADLLDGQLPKR